MTDPVRIAITGAAGQICYSMMFRIASGGMYGPNQPVALQLLEIPQAMGCLLYTSPSPRDATLSRMPSSA